MKTSFIIVILVCFFSLGRAVSGEIGSHEVSPERPIKSLSGFNFGEALTLVLVDPNQKAAATPEERHPWIKLFENGKDINSRDLQSTLDFLKLARSMGRKKIRPDADKAPGLIITFRGIELTPNADSKGYTLKLVGEFNSTEFQLDESQMRNLFAGKLTTWDLTSETSRTTGPIRYIIKTQLKLRLSLENQALKVHSLEGGGSITSVTFTNKETYTSPMVSLGNSQGMGTLYEGRPGVLPKLPTIK
jgi:hypothetical protein